MKGLTRKTARLKNRERADSSGKVGKGKLTVDSGGRRRCIRPWQTKRKAQNESIEKNNTVMEIDWVLVFGVRRVF